MTNRTMRIKRLRVVGEQRSSPSCAYAHERHLNGLILLHILIKEALHLLRCRVFILSSNRAMEKILSASLHKKHYTTGKR